MMRFSVPNLTQQFTSLLTNTSEQTITREELQADQFVEAFLLLENDIQYKTKILNSVEFYVTQFTEVDQVLNAKVKKQATPVERTAAKEKLAKLNILLQNYFQKEFLSNTDSTQAFMESKGGTLAALTYLQSAYSSNITDLKNLLQTIQDDLKDGTTLMSYLLCKQIIGIAEQYRLPKHISKKFSAEVNAKIDQASDLQLFNEVLNLIEPSLTPDEIEIKNQVEIYFRYDSFTHGVDFFS